MAPKISGTKRAAGTVCAGPMAGGKAKVKTAIPVRKCRALIAKVQGMAGLPFSLRQMLARLGQGLVAEGKRHLGTEAGTAILGKALRGVESTLETALQEAQAGVSGADAEREARRAAQALAESKLAELRQAVKAKKSVLGDSGKAIEAKRQELVCAKSAQRTAEAEVKAVAGKQRHVEAIEKEAYEPLKEEPAGGLLGQRRLASLRKAGKEFGFHTELLIVMPAVLRKRPEKRRTFDGLAMQQLEVEFARRAGALEIALRDGEQATAERACNVQAAQVALLGARADQKRSAQELAAAEAAIVAGRQAVAAARRHVRRLPSDMRQAVRSLARIEGRMNKFRNGPLASFRRALLPRPARVGRHGPAMEDLAPGAEPQ